MKRWICFILTAALCAMALTACGNSGGQRSSANVQEQVSDEDTQQSTATEEQGDAAEPEGNGKQEAAATPEVF